MGKNRVTYDARAFQQDASNAMKADIVRGLIELITNSDDAYGDEAHGKIRIEVEHKRSKPWKVVVRDRAKGMRKATMITAIGHIGGRTSGFESGARVRGNLGRGAKDLAAFGPVTFESICEGYYSKMVLESDGTFDDPTERKTSKEHHDQLRTKNTGTTVTVLVADRFRCPQHRNLVDKLSKHFQLRDINSDPRREITLVDSNNDVTDGIRYGRPSLEECLAREFAVPGYEGATASITIMRGTERYENPAQDTSRPEGILVKGRRAIYENTLFSFESNPHAHWFCGTLICDWIDKLALEFDNLESNGSEHSSANPMPIITRSREGLEHEHPFYRALAGGAEEILGELVREEERKAKEGEIKENARLRRSLDSLGRDLGRLVDADLREIEEDGLVGGPGQEPTVPLRIIPEGPVLYMGEDKTLSVIASRELEQKEIRVELDPEGVVQLLDEQPFPLEDHLRREDCQIARIRLRPLIEDDETCLVVRCGSEEAVATVKVRPQREEPEPKPPEEFEFERAHYQLAHGKKRTLLLRAPVDVINRAGTSSSKVVSSDQGIVVLGGAVEMAFDEAQLCFVGSVQVDPRTLGAKATLTATLGDFTAKCEATVAQNEGGGPRLHIKIVDETQGRYRAYVEREGEVTTIKIFGGHSAIKRYLGPAPDFPEQDSLQARLVIAEIVAGEAARLVMEKKFRTPGELDGPAFYAEHLAYLEKYLSRCHRMMLDQ